MKCNLLSLPPELHNHIYELAFMEEQPIFADLQRDHACARLRQPDSAMVSSEFRKKVLPIFHGPNKFREYVQDKPEILEAWLIADRTACAAHQEFGAELLPPACNDVGARESVRQKSGVCAGLGARKGG